jgi:hypothetical protein
MPRTDARAWSVVSNVAVVDGSSIISYHSFAHLLLVHDVWFLSCLAEHWQDQRDLPAEAAHIKQFQRCLNCVKEVSLHQRLFNYIDDNSLIR